MGASIILRQEGPVGRITLNRPEALHALNTEMCLAITDALRRWRDDDSVELAVIDHAAETRGFCAGGDIRMLAESGAGDARAARAFFQAEYRMNTAIAEFPKPYLALMDGVTMGGGVGLSVHGSHRVATDRTVFAMPETGIGLFPDVGGGWFLPRLDGELGTWLALTGARLKSSDVVAAGIGTHFIPSERIEALNAALRALSTGHAAGALDALLDQFADPVGPADFQAHRETIDTCFAADTAEAIRDRLRASDHPWAHQQAETLLSKSPETVKVALRQLREGARCLTFRENMRMEYRIGWRKVTSHDFQEGVRAVILDKDNAPAWKPETLEAVAKHDVDRYFEKLGEDELSFD